MRNFVWFIIKRKTVSAIVFLSVFERQQKGFGLQVWYTTSRKGLKFTNQNKSKRSSQCDVVWIFTGTGNAIACFIVALRGPGRVGKSTHACVSKFDTRLSRYHGWHSLKPSSNITVEYSMISRSLRWQGAWIGHPDRQSKLLRQPKWEFLQYMDNCCTIQRLL